MSAESNRAALRKLIRKFHAQPDIEKRLSELRKDSDMAAAITGAALVEAGLESLLLARFPIKSPILAGQLFQNRGPLSDFHSKILVARAMDIITSVMAEEMHSIKTIRNFFAHAKMAISFDHQLIQRELDSFKTVTAFKTAASEKIRDIPPLDLSTKEGFLLAVLLHLIIMDETKKFGISADATIKGALKASADKEKASSQKSG